MLQSLHIKNYAIIDEVNLSFDPTYNVITGETGAGKSILLGALNLIRGTRADTKVLYDLNAKCIVEANFKVTPNIIKNLKDVVDADFETTEIIIRREISSSGKSRAFINDTPVRLLDIKLVATAILDIHNQFDTLSIATPEYQLKVIDTIADNSKILHAYKEVYRLYLDLTNEIKKLERAKQKSSENQDFINYQLEELEKIELDNIVKKELLDEHSTLSNSERIVGIISQMNQEFHESEHNISSRLSHYIRELNDLGNINPQLSEIRDNLNDASELLNEVDFISNRVIDNIDMGSERLEELTDIIDHINRLEKKHSASSIEELIAIRDDYNMRAQGSDNLEDLISKKKTELSNVEIRINKAAKALSKSRSSIFERLIIILERSLSQLAIPNAKILIQKETLPHYEESGIDEITFSFSANKGIEPRPISEVASGGELSRLALSVKSTVADQYEVPTLIFDEIDTGISGAVAKRVGEIFQHISDSRQVICITHSPQVASLANRHFLVEKRDTATRTITNVKMLEGEQRIVEIAKMLSTDPPGVSAIENAKELLAGY